MRTVKCKNKRCPKFFNTKSKKKEYCNNCCKNEASYDRVLEKYPWEIYMAKARRKVVKIIEKLYITGRLNVTASELSIVGVSLLFAYFPDVNSNNQSVFRFENYHLTVIDKNQYVISKI